MTKVQTYLTHSAYSDPGRHAALVAAVNPEPEAIHHAAWNTILHYRADEIALSDEQREDVDRRWLATLLDVGQERAPGPLDAPREPAQRLAGCCRDHTLLAVSVMREHGIPARSRVGFAGYFSDGFHHDHVVAEYWSGERWVRFDPELDQAHFPFDVHDLPSGPDAPFRTAAEVWRLIRSGDTDPDQFGVDPSMPMLCGTGFVRAYVITELAHRMRDEVLLWDVWGAAAAAIDGAPDDGSEAQADTIAELLVRADAGDDDAEAELVARYAREPGLAPGRTVMTMSPMGRRGLTDLAERTTAWQESESPDEVAHYTVPVH
jgi:hypothetical protein